MSAYPPEGDTDPAEDWAAITVGELTALRAQLDHWIRHAELVERERDSLLSARRTGGVQTP